MPRNIEIKARAESLTPIFERCKALATEGPIALTQDDTFFLCEHGRLKLRVESEGKGSLIFYQRSDQKGPKSSFYLHTPTDEPDLLRESLTLAYGQQGRVRKQRQLFWVGRTRVHLDDVENLGFFVELEVLMQEGESEEVAIEEANRLMRALGILPMDLVDCAYLDLLQKKDSDDLSQF